MSGRRTNVLVIRELFRHLRAGDSDRQVAGWHDAAGLHETRFPRVVPPGQVAEALHVTRRTVAKYRTWAKAHNLLTGSLPTPEDLVRLLEQDLPASRPPKGTSSVEPYRAIVTDLRQRGVEIATIFQRLHDDHGYTGSYSSVHRFVRALEPAVPDVTIRIERPPGEEAQVDFGYAGLMLDEHGQRRRAWALVMTLSYSRHQYVEFVFDQKVETWLLLHCHAFESFGGVPRKVVLDNLKAGIIKACFDDPQVQRAYRDLAEYYGFLVAPCRPRQPQEKGKVESGVHFVVRRFLAGKEPAPLTENNLKVQTWVAQTAGLRLHDTTKWQPLPQFERVERPTLQPLPETPFELATWKQVKLHRNCYVTFDKAYYSAPHRFVDQKLWGRGDARTVRVYAEYQLSATHPRATEPGQRRTHPDHLPPHRVDALTLTPERCQAEATAIGPWTLQVVEALLAERPLDRLRSLRKLLRLAERYSPLRLERACARAVRFDTATYVSVKHILEQSLNVEDYPTPLGPSLERPQFARTAQELLGAATGGDGWTTSPTSRPSSSSYGSRASWKAWRSATATPSRSDCRTSSSCRGSSRTKWSGAPRSSCSSV